jgi:hypothetical protein
MQADRKKSLALAAPAAALAGAAALAAEKPQVDTAAVDKSFETLKTYDWGDDRKALNPIDDAVVATEGDAAARKELEARLLAALGGGASRSAKDFILRKLRTVGTAPAAPALGALLTDPDLSHMARYALERIEAPEAAAALRDALPKVRGKLKVGVIGSLGVRGDAAGVAALKGLPGDADKAVAAAAAHALGLIGTPEAGKALADWQKKAPESLRVPITDACLTCAERLLADGKKTEAASLYTLLKGEDQPKYVQVAATRGLLQVMQ